MNVRTSVLRGFALLALSSLAFTACDDKATEPVVPTPVAITVTPEQATLTVGQTTNFVAVVRNTTNTAVTWSSSNNAVATVSATGVVTAVAPGTTTITAASVADPTARTAAQVIVNAAPVPPPITVAVVPSAASLLQGQTVQLVPVVGNTTTTTVTYSSSDQTVATVSASGLVTAVGPGTSVITVRSTADVTKFATAVITVTALPPVVVTVTPPTATGVVGQQVGFSATVAGLANQTVTWTSSNTAVATVDGNGVATLVGPGTAVIRALAANGTSAGTATLIVTALPITVAISPTAATGQAGTSFAFSAAVGNSADQRIEFRSTNPTVATIDATTGIASLLTAGSTQIIAISRADTTRRATATLTVTAAPPAEVVTVTITPTTATLAPGAQQQFVATSSNSTDAVRFFSSNTAVLTVDSITGVATGVSAGAATVRARSTVDVTRSAQAAVTVTSAPPVTITVNPTSIPSLGAGASAQIAATVAGAENTTVTCTSANGSVATVVVTADGRGCTVTGVAAGNTVITVASVADPTKIQTVAVGVVGASVAIANIPASPAAGVLTINVNVSVPAGTADRLMLTLRNAATGVDYTVRCQTFTAAGAATTVSCPINPADIDPNTAGAQVLPNGTYTVIATLMRGDVVAATATFGTQLTTNNANTVAGLVSFDNTLVDTDNAAAPNSVVTGAGVIWNGGSATVSLASSIFQGNAISTVTIVADLNCNGVDDGAGEASRSISIGANGAGTVTFAENLATGSAPTNGIDNVEMANVCFAVTNPRDANNVPVQLAAGGAGGATGNVIVGGTALNPIPGAGQNQFNIDNVEPDATVLAAMTFDPADFDGLSTNVYLGTNSSVTATGANPTVLGAVGPDAGVGGVTVTYYAVPIGSFNGASQATLRASAEAAGSTAFSSPAGLAETTSNGGYALVIEVKDALGNRYFRGGPVFGVDLQAPTIAVVGASSAPADAVNPATMNVRFAVTDTNSGAEGVTGSVSGYSVLEIDADGGTELRCYNLVGGLVATNPVSGSCANFTTTAPVVTVGTEERYDVTIPAAENFYVLTFVSRDAAGNSSTASITRQALIDNTAGPDAGTGLATVTINNYTIDNENNTATVNGVVRDNIEVAATDARFEFTGLTTADGTNVPDAVPFTPQAMVGTYGLPLTAIQPVSATSPVNVEAIYVGAAAANANGANFDVDNFGFGMWDLANNFAFAGVAVPDGTINGITMADYQLTSSAASIDRTPAGGAAGSTTLSVVTTVAPGAANPTARTYLYVVNPGQDLTYGTGDDFNQLITEFLAGTATMQTGETARTYTHSTSVSATSLPANVAGFDFRFFTVSVAADGDAVISPVAVVDVQN